VVSRGAPVERAAPTHAAGNRRRHKLIALANSNSPALQDAILPHSNQKNHQRHRLDRPRVPTSSSPSKLPQNPLSYCGAAGPADVVNSAIRSLDASAASSLSASYHSFHYSSMAQSSAARLDSSLHPRLYQQPSVPTGKLSDKITHVSKIYDGMKSDYWIYVPGSTIQNTPAALWSFRTASGTGPQRKQSALNVIDT